DGVYSGPGRGRYRLTNPRGRAAPAAPSRARPAPGRLPVEVQVESSAQSNTIHTGDRRPLILRGSVTDSSQVV
ncbi:MAG: hypothetical protein ACJ786_17510, partial [Catenulispora sp.]